MRLRDLYDRTEVCKSRYWNIPKYTRIDLGLRSEVGVSGDSATIVISAAEELLSKGLRGKYLFDVDAMINLSEAEVPETSHHLGK